MKLPQVAVLAALFALATAAVPAAASAQPGPGNEETIRGSIVSLDGAGNLELRDDRGFIDSVRLEPNVNVTPAGFQLQPGTRVTITGANAGAVFAAETVAAAPGSVQGAGPATNAPPPIPYAYPYPYPVPYPVYAYPYPVYAYPYPAFSFGVGFGPSQGWGFRGRRR